MSERRRKVVVPPRAFLVLDPLVIYVPNYDPRWVCSQILGTRFQEALAGAGHGATPVARLLVSEEVHAV